MTPPQDEPWLARSSDATWHVVDRLFSAALELPPSERRAWLETSAPDARLAAEVLLLVSEAEASGLPLDSRDDGWLRGLWEDLDPSAEDPLIGATVGSYRIMRSIGSGGMGSVYLAEREGEEFEQRVAVKVLRPGLETTEGRARFRSERRILASLDHPSIASLFDGGATAHGRPYFVMEYVEGVPITEHVDAASLDVAAVLRLFLTVADAVEHAHRHLVVHRDIKPSNVLVRPDGKVKLLDFGIARLMDAEDIERTATQSRAMTPAYAAPEQFLGQPVTTATDVYQLGTLLYELLTGTPVFGRGSDPREMERRIVDDVPEQPSARLSGVDAARARRLRGDLDILVMKALRKEPHRRYGSAGALADDVRRYLDRRPITARPDTLGYRLRSAMRRRPWFVPAATAAAIAVVLYVGTLVRHTRSLEAERAVSDQVEAFLLDLFRPADPRATDGATVTARELLQAGALRVRDDLAGQPELQARLAEVMGSAFTALSDYSPARDAFRLRLDAVRESGDEGSEEHAQALTDLGVALGNAGEFEASDSVLTVALAAWNELDPSHPRVGWTLIQRGQVRTSLGDHEAAEADFAAWLPLVESSPPVADVDYLEAMESVYWMRMATGRRDEAFRIAASALELAEEGFGPTNPVVAQKQALLMNALYQQERDEEAIQIGTRALATFDAAFGPDGGADMVDLLSGLGLLHFRTGSLDEAAGYFSRATELGERYMGTESPNMIQIHQGMADVYRAQANYGDARSALSRAQEIADALMGGPNALSGSIEAEIGEVVEAQGDTVAAAAHYASALDQLEGSRGWRPPKVIARRRLAAHALRDGRGEEAERYLLEALDVTVEGGDTDLEREVRTDLVAVYEALGRPAEAAEQRAAIAGGG